MNHFSKLFGRGSALLAALMLPLALLTPARWTST
jgi:hypothetical protein